MQAIGFPEEWSHFVNKTLSFQAIRMHYMKHNGQRKVIVVSDERESEIFGPLAALGFDCCNEPSLPITHCII